MVYMSLGVVPFKHLISPRPIIIKLAIGNLVSVGFEKTFLMQNNMNLSASEVIETYSYRIGLASSNANFSYAAAIGFFNSVINLVLILIVNKLAKKYSDTSLW